MHATIQTANRGDSALDRPSAFRHDLNRAPGYADPYMAQAKFAHASINLRRARSSVERR